MRTNNHIEHELTAINYHGDIYPAAVCPICRGRVWPAEALKAHLDHHAHVARYGHEPGPVTRRKMMQEIR